MRWFYLYLILDLYSRKIVGYTVANTDDADHAAHLARRTALAEGIHGLHDKPVLHGDNGATLKATTVLAMLHWLGVKPSYSRPRVSDDNAFVESLFALLSIARSSRNEALPIWSRRAPGRRPSSIGRSARKAITMTTPTAASVM